MIGTYRVLAPDAAERAGGLYSDTEFDLTRLRPCGAALWTRPLLRAPGLAHRGRHASMALWGALNEFMVRNDLDTMVGCASVSMRDGGHMAASLWEKLRRTHLAAIEWHVRPRLALPVDDLRCDLSVGTPELCAAAPRCSGRRPGTRTSTPPTCR